MDKNVNDEKYNRRSLIRGDSSSNIVYLADVYPEFCANKPLTVDMPSFLGPHEDDEDGITSPPKEVWHPSHKDAIKLKLVLLR